MAQAKGHPNFHYLSCLFPSLCPTSYVNLEIKCEVCESTKQHRSSYPRTPYTPTMPFTPIHSDLWRSSHNPKHTNPRWFLTFIDDHTCVCWIHMLKDKFEAPNVFIKFFNMFKN